MKLLFVCLGNICRSPAAEAVMQKLVNERLAPGSVVCDSAGTCAYHAGEPADRRMQSALSARGYRAQSISRQVDPAIDFDQFDYILAMDAQNLHDLQQIKPDRAIRAKIGLICEYVKTRKEREVPDPYYGGTTGFDQVIDILEDACASFLEEKFSGFKPFSAESK